MALQITKNTCLSYEVPYRGIFLCCLYTLFQNSA